MFKCLGITAHRKALVKYVEAGPSGGPQSTGLIMFIAHRFPNPLPDESIVTEASSVPILGKTLGELQDWAVKLNGGKWSLMEEPNFGFAKMYTCLIKQ